MGKTKIQIGSLRVWVARNVPAKAEYKDVEDTYKALLMIHNMIEEDLKDESIKDNTFGLEIYGENGWEEWASHDGEDIMQVLENDKDYYLLYVFGDVEPELVGPFITEGERDEVAV